MVDGLQGNQLPPPGTAFVKQFHNCGLANLCSVSHAERPYSDIRLRIGLAGGLNANFLKVKFLPILTFFLSIFPLCPCFQCPLFKCPHKYATKLMVLQVDLFAPGLGRWYWF